jgi:hypothetical protein
MALWTTTRKADYYLDATLRALKPVTVYRYPNGPFVRSVSPGSIVGEIYSWVERENGLWWLLKEGGAVLHAPGTFDARLAEYSGQGKEWEILEAREVPAPGVGSFVSAVGGFLKWAVIAFIAYLIFKLGRP